MQIPLRSICTGYLQRSVAGNIMTAKNDWRLQGQEKYLKGITLTLKPYSKYRDGWDHDHCEFCQAKFMESNSIESLHEGYASKDNYHWICLQCFNDFKKMFE